MTYVDLLENCSKANFLSEPENSSDPLNLPSELELQSLWFSGRFGREFSDQDGTKIYIKQFGIWNRSTGPDFLNACVLINDQEFKGPIELDTHPSDWTSHGHIDDPAFEKTILHIVFRETEKTSFTRTSENKHVRQITIPRERIEQALNLSPLTTSLAQFGRCSYPLSKFSPGKINTLMEEAAKHRLRLKGRIFSETENISGYDEALWQATAQTLGYRPNALQLRLLTQRLTIKNLNTRKDIESLLFGISDFLHPEIVEHATDDSRDYLLNLWDSWWAARSEYALDESRSISFTTSAIRPINHPQRRIAALAEIAKNWSDYRTRALEILKSPRQFIQKLSELSNPFWSHHYTLSSTATTKPMALIGRNRSTDLLINHLLPHSYLKDETATWDSYAKLPASTNNEKLKRAIIRLLGQRDDLTNWTKKAWQQQAILQIYQDFCLQDTSDCHDCAFPEQLSQW